MNLLVYSVIRVFKSSNLAAESPWASMNEQ